MILSNPETGQMGFAKGIAVTGEEKSFRCNLSIHSVHDTNKTKKLDAFRESTGSIKSSFTEDCKLMTSREGYDAYQLYLGIKLHFYSDYDFIKYNGKVRGDINAFLKRKDKYHFGKLFKLYGRTYRTFMLRIFVLRIRMQSTWLMMKHHSKFIRTGRNVIRSCRTYLNRKYQTFYLSLKSKHNSK